MTHQTLIGIALVLFCIALDVYAINYPFHFAVHPANAPQRLPLANLLNGPPASVELNRAGGSFHTGTGVGNGKPAQDHERASRDGLSVSSELLHGGVETSLNLFHKNETPARDHVCAEAAEVIGLISGSPAETQMPLRAPLSEDETTEPRIGSQYPVRVAKREDNHGCPLRAEQGVQLSRPEPIQQIDCPTCEGQGGYMRECQHCCGQGCAMCRRKGEVGVCCETCDGKGTVEKEMEEA